MWLNLLFAVALGDIPTFFVVELTESGYSIDDTAKDTYLKNEFAIGRIDKTINITGKFTLFRGFFQILPADLPNITENRRSPYLGHIVLNNKPILYIFDLFLNNELVDLETAKRAVTDFMEIAIHQPELLMNPQPLIDDLYQFSEAREGESMHQDGITVVTVTKDRKGNAVISFHYTVQNSILDIESTMGISVDVRSASMKITTDQNSAYKFPDGWGEIVEKKNIRIDFARNEVLVGIIDKIKRPQKFIAFSRSFMSEEKLIARAFFLRGVLPKSFQFWFDRIKIYAFADYKTIISQFGEKVLQHPQKHVT